MQLGPRAPMSRTGSGSPVPWAGRDEDRDDDTVWAIACLIVRKGHRGRRLTYPLVAAAVEHARARGAVGPFIAAGFAEITHPTERRLVMRIDL